MNVSLVSKSKGYRFAAISLICVAALLSGCATKQDVIRVDEKVNQIRNDQKLLNVRMARVDSLLTNGTGEDNRLRAEVTTSLSQLGDQIDRMMNQLNDLQQQVYRLSQEGMATGDTPPVVAVVPDTSATAQADTSSAGANSISRDDCRRLWDNAFKDMTRGQYDLAIAGFTDYIDFCPNGDLLDNSQYWLAEAYYEMKQYERAIEEYKKLLSEYPDTEKKAAAYFKLGRSYEELGDKNKALEYYRILRDEFPGTVEFDQVKDKVAEWEKQ